MRRIKVTKYNKQASQFRKQVITRFDRINECYRDFSTIDLSNV
jgi:hypothetical protein